ncbi:MAG: TIR domain-containing protein [Desulfobacterales bacterium]|nr:TIR domain-containing protein [Desulfobacterales bacterium]
MQKGLFPWMDTPDLVPGQRKKQTTRKTIQESRWFLAILSSKSLSQKGQVHSQIRLALDLLDEFPDSKIFFIPVRTDDCKIENEKLQNLPSYEKGFANKAETQEIWASVMIDICNTHWNLGIREQGDKSISILQMQSKDIRML